MANEGKILVERRNRGLARKDRETAKNGGAVRGGEKRKTSAPKEGEKGKGTNYGGEKGVMLHLVLN